MKMWRFRFSIATRWLAFQAGGMILILLLVTLIQFRNISSGVFAEVENSGRTAAQAIKEVLAEDPDLFNSRLLQPIVLRFDSRLPNLSHVSIVDSSGRIIADSDPSSVGRYTNDSRLSNLAQEAGEERLISQRDGKNYLRLLSTIEGRYDPIRRNTAIGALALEMELSLAEQRIHQIFIRSLGMVVGAFLAIWLVQQFLVNRGFLRTLNQLAAAAEKIGHGDLSARAQVRTHDEIGKLAETFNRMASQVEMIHHAEVAERQQAQAALTESHSKLQAWVKELEKRRSEDALLQKMVDHLQSCVTEGEAYDAIRQTAQKLFVQDSGSLWLIAESRNCFELALSWSGFDSPHPIFALEDCWALRKGRPHWVEEADIRMLCKHVNPQGPFPMLCLPLVAQTETLGLLNFQGDSEKVGREERLRLASAVAERAGLALANLKLRKTLRNQSIRDPLTGLFNRRYMEESLDRELRRAIRHNSPLAVIMLDVDHFKSFNDQFGHAGGDAFLQTLGKFLEQNIRAEDIACRYGGEEFILILPDSTLETARTRCEQLQTLIKGLNVRFHGQVLNSVTTSIGVAAHPEHGSSAAVLLRAADEALYRAKIEGRDRVVLAAISDKVVPEQA